MKFLADSSLGRLSKWLRILGYDTVYWRGEADRAFLRKAEREGRAVLTRRKDVLARQHPGLVLFVENDRVEDQLVEVLGKLDLKPESGQALHPVPSLQRTPDGSHAGRGAAACPRLCVHNTKSIPGVPEMPRGVLVWNPPRAGALDAQALTGTMRRGAIRVSAVHARHHGASKVTGAGNR